MDEQEHLHLFRRALSGGHKALGLAGSLVRRAFGDAQIIAIRV